MVEAPRRLRFLLETPQPSGIGRNGRWQNLDRNVTSELAISGAIDLTHAAGAQRGDDFVPAETGSRGEAHLELNFVLSSRTGALMMPRPDPERTPGWRSSMKPTVTCLGLDTGRKFRYLVPREIRTR